MKIHGLINVYRHALPVWRTNRQELGTPVKNKADSPFNASSPGGREDNQLWETGDLVARIRSDGLSREVNRLTDAAGVLDKAQGRVVDVLHLLTGRERRVDELEPEQTFSLQTLLPALMAKDDPSYTAGTVCDLINRVLLALGIPPMTRRFYMTFFEEAPHFDIEDAKNRVTQLRQLCMLEFGNFRFGYKKYNTQPDLLKRHLSEYFPSETEIADRVALFRSRPEIKGIQEILPGERFSLGYIAKDQADAVSASGHRELRVGGH